MITHRVRHTDYSYPFKPMALTQAPTCKVVH